MSLYPSSHHHDAQDRERPPLYYEMGGLPGERYPQLHEQQIERAARPVPPSPAPPAPAPANREWARRREQRVREYARRVEQHLRHHSRRKQPGEVTNGKRQAVWCVELRQCFDSLSAAARVVGRAPSNILQSIRLHVRCGGYHWERFDPQRHLEPMSHTGAESFHPSSDPTAEQAGISGSSSSPKDDAATERIRSWRAIAAEISRDGSGEACSAGAPARHLMNSKRAQGETYVAA